MNETILIIEDEPEIQSILAELLTDAGYQVHTASDGLEGITAFRKSDYQLVLLDLMLPKIDGFTVCEMIRQESTVPVIILTALDEEENQIKGFDMLADDYITKPFSLMVVRKRVEAALRRGAVTSHSDRQDTVLTYQNIRLNPVEARVYVSGIPVLATKLEYELLHLFMRRPGRVFTRNELLDLVWGHDYEGYEKSVNIHIMNLRRKLQTDCIESVRGVGYRFGKSH